MTPRWVRAHALQESPVSTDGSTTDRLVPLIAAIEAVATRADLEAALEGVLAAAAGLGPAMAAILIQDPDRPAMQVVASIGFDESALGQLASDVADPAHPFAEAAAGRKATFDREAAMADGSPFVGAYLPLVVASGGVEVALGSLGLGWPAPHELDASDRRFLEALASLAAVAADRARMSSTAAERSDWFERMAHTDPLTGLANERTVGRILELELARAARQGSEVSLAMFDVDDFQATNLSGGHEAGDAVLRRVAAVLAESVRLVDTVGRIGGDEFVLVAPGSAGMTVAHRVLEGITALPAIAGRPITVSAGVARFPVDGADAESLIAAASNALARAREDGRGRVAAGATPER
ncbi:MAG TPA: GGDEF domain-containing protein [Candidatus Limnocylindrales bacterium]|nr:GGDEF domain-containing protein [Candidatus Limnocylindrales bacterium]